jgi:hypothetical protein
MASWEDVRRLALALPSVTEQSSRGDLDWRVNNKSFVWERPLRASDRAALGDTAPDGEILGARVPDEGAKFALIADDPTVYFTTPHFDGYPAILVQLANINEADLDELVVEAWLTRAPKKLAAAYLAERG